MKAGNSVLRQLIYAIAMPTGIALVSMLLGCAQPSTSLSAPGFPHASRRSIPQLETMTQRISSSRSDTLLEVVWIRPGEGGK